MKNKYTIFFVNNFSFLLIFGTAFVLRIYRLPAQSVWFDELLIYAALSCANIHDLLWNLFIYLAEMAITPLYFVFIYSISAVVGIDVLLLRMCSLLPGLISIVLLFILGRRIAGKRAGLVAALCLALSPQHIWHNQEIRPYSLLFMFCLLALLGLLQWRSEGKRRWFILNFLANGLLLFTHLFGVLFLLPQGLYLLQRKEFKTFCKWASSHAVLVIILLFVILLKPHLSEGYHSRPLLSASLILFRILPSLMTRSIAGDVLYWHNGLWPAFETSAEGVGFYWFPQILLLRFVFDWGLLLLIMGCVGIFTLHTAWGCLKDFLHGLRTRNWSISSPLAEQVLLVSLALIPSAILAALTLIFWTNFSDYGHDIYNTIAVYIIMGSLLSRFTKRAFVSVIVLLVLLFGYQCLIFLPGSTRTEWRLGAQYIKTNASKEDLVLDFWFHGPVSRKKPYFEDSTLLIRQVSTITDICDEATRFYIKQIELGLDSKQDASVWLMAETRLWQEMIGDPAFIPLLEKGLAVRGLVCSIQEFPGGFNLVVAQIHPAPSGNPHLPKTLSRELWTVDYESVLSELGLKEVSPDRQRKFLDILQRTVGMWPAVNAMGRVSYPLDLIREGDLELAEAMARRLVLENPSFGLGYLALGMVWAAQGEDQRALAAFQSGFSHHIGLRRFFGEFTDALCRQKDLDAAASALISMQEIAVPLFPEIAAYILELRRHAVPIAEKDRPKDRNNPINAPIAAGKLSPSDPIFMHEISSVYVPGVMSSEEKWMDNVFEAQETLSGLTYWFPFHKHFPALGIQACLRLTGNIEKAIRQYESLIKKFPFEKQFYENYNVLLLRLNNPAEYIKRWLDCIYNNPAISAFAARKLAYTGERWFDEGKSIAAIAAFEEIVKIAPANNSYVHKLELFRSSIR